MLDKTKEYLKVTLCFYFESTEEDEDTPRYRTQPISAGFTIGYILIPKFDFNEKIYSEDIPRYIKNLLISGNFCEQNDDIYIGIMSITEPSKGDMRKIEGSLYLTHTSLHDIRIPLLSCRKIRSNKQVTEVTNVLHVNDSYYDEMIESLT